MTLQRLFALAAMVLFAGVAADVSGKADPLDRGFRSAVTLEKVGEGFEITSSHLDVTAKIPGADQAKFEEIANKAKTGCPVSTLLKAKITMDAKLET